MKEPLIRTLIKEALKEAELSIGKDNTNFGIRVDLGNPQSETKRGIRIKSHGVGKYGRVLAEIYIQDKEGNSINVNKKLIHEGHAYIYDGGKKKVYTY